MWRQVPYPVRTALAAAHLLRQMANKYENIDPMTADDMRTNADYFEEESIVVQNEAEDDDQVCLAPSAPGWFPVVTAFDGVG